MTKNFLQDVVPPEDRSIRHIPLPDRKPRKTRNSPAQKLVESGRNFTDYLKETHENISQKIPKMKGKSNTKIFIWGGAIVLIIALIFVISFLFGGATVTVTPKKQLVSVDATITLQKGATSGVSALGYELLISTSTKEQILSATKQEQVQKKASGQILIYNSFSSAPQRLIKNTRFESTKGLIYRIDSSVTVPGMTLGKKGEKIPGSVVATIFADSPGQNYNMRLADLSGDFTIPGFKSSPRYTTFFGRLKTDISGGFSGMAPVVPADTLSTAKKTLEADLEKDILTKVSALVPKTSILYKELFFVTFETLPYTDMGNGNVKITEQATSYAVLINQRDLSRSIASRAIAGFDGAPVVLKDIEKMEVKIVNKNESEPWNKPSFPFSIKGSGTLIWLFDDVKLKNDLKDLPKKNVSEVLSKYPAIEKTEIVIRPFWKSAFPSEEKDITIVKKLDD